MSNSPEEEAAMATVREAEALIRNATRQIEEGEAFFGQLGIKREKLRAYVNQSVSADDRRKAEEEARKDLAEVDDEVHQAKLRSSPRNATTATGSKPKRPRNIV